MGLLTWTFLAKRRMTIKEIQHALAVKPGDEEFDMDDVASQRTILNSCLGLVIVDQETATVRFVHYSLQEFFQKHDKEFSPTGHNSLARTCLTYINFGEFAAKYKRGTAQDLLNKYPLVEYAAIQWASHASEQWDSVVGDLLYRMVLRHIRGTPMSVLMYIISQGSGVIVSQRRHRGVTLFGALFWPRKYFATSLHAVILLGNVHMMEYILEKLSVDGRIDSTVANATDRTIQTPLAYAAAVGREDMIRLLLSRSDVNPDTKDDKGQTPLFLAAKMGHLDAVRMLLSHSSVDVNARTATGLTALAVTVQRDCEELVHVLLSHSGVDINMRYTDGRTALMDSIREFKYSRRSRFRFFLSRDPKKLKILQALLNHSSLDVNMEDYEGNTALMLAVEVSSEKTSTSAELIQLLLNHSGMDVNVRSKNGNTALIYAIMHGFVGAVKLLLSHRGIEVNTIGRGGRTGLSWAAFWGRVEIVKLLVDYQGVDLDAKDNGGMTALDLAIDSHTGLISEECGEEIAKLLTDRGAKRGSEIEEQSPSPPTEIPNSDSKTPEPTFSGVEEASFGTLCTTPNLDNENPKLTSPETPKTPEKIDKDILEVPSKEVSTSLISSGVTGSRAWRWGWLYSHVRWLILMSSCALFIFVFFSLYNYFQVPDTKMSFLEFLVWLYVTDWLLYRDVTNFIVLAMSECIRISLVMCFFVSLFQSVGPRAVREALERTIGASP